MKKLVTILLCCFALQISAQTAISSKQWQDDLRFLQTTVNEDYPFLFKKTTSQEFNSAVETLHDQIPNMEDHEVIVGLSRVIALFKYGHTDISFRQEPFTFRQFPFNFYQYNDGVYIQGTHKNYEKALGAKVNAINGISIEDALKTIAPVVPSENDQYFKAFGINYLRIPEVLHAQGISNELSDTVELTLKKNGETFKQSFTALEKGKRIPVQYSHLFQKDDWLEARNQSETPLYLKNIDKIYYYEYLAEEKAVYVRHSQIQDDPSEDIPTFYKGVFDFIEANDVEKLILDVRLNGGGNNYKNKAVVTGIIKSEKINQVGNLFVILGRRTFSACQNLVNELDSYTNALFIGEPTSENVNFYGDNRQVELPNSKIPVFLSFAWWQDKPQWENDEWLAPHISVDMSYSEYNSNKDPVLDVALNFAGEGFIKDPMAHFTNLFQTGNIEQLEKDAVDMVKDPRYSFFDFESEFNTAGYNLMGSNMNQEAIFVFTMISKLFPDSANAWDSLAEGYMTAGDLEKAKEYYNKAISLDPEGSTGDNARNMLKKIERGH